MKWAVVLLVVSACDSIDLAGAYRVDADYTCLGCEAPTELSSYPVLTIDISRVDGGYAMALNYKDSTTTPQTVLAAVNESSWSGGEGKPVPNGEVASHCSLVYSKYDLMLSGPNIVVEWRQCSTAAETAEQCTVEEATRWGSMRSCPLRERIEATKL